MPLPIPCGQSPPPPLAAAARRHLAAYPPSCRSVNAAALRTDRLGLQTVGSLWMLLVVAKPLLQERLPCEQLCAKGTSWRQRQATRACCPCCACAHSLRLCSRLSLIGSLWPSPPAGLALRAASHSVLAAALVALLAWRPATWARHREVFVSLFLLHACITTLGALPSVVLPWGRAFCPA